MVLIDVILYIVAIIINFPEMVLAIGATVWAVRYKDWLLDVLYLDGYDSLWQKYRDKRHNVSRETFRQDQGNN